MPAVSGSPTQIETSCSSIVELIGTPDDAFRDGDFATVTAAALGGSVISTYQLNRTATGPANNVTIFPTFSGNGFWILFPGANLTGASASAFINPGAGVAIPGVLGSVLQVTLVMPGPGVLDMLATMILDGGTDGSSVLGNLQVTIDANPPAQVDGSTIGTVGSPLIVPVDAATVAAMSGRRLAVNTGQSIVVDVMLQDQALNADGQVVSASLIARFFPA